MNKRNDDIVSTRLKELPTHAPADGLWQLIESALDMEDAISKRIADLPEYSPGINMWEDIESGLSVPDQSNTKRWYLLPAAAAVLFLLSLPWLIQRNSGIIVETEIILSEAEPSGSQIGNDEADPIDVIENLCKTGTPACQSANFREKFQLYMELDNELRQLETIIDRVGDSPEIIQSVIRIENLKSNTLQELIQLIYS